MRPSLPQRLMTRAAALRAVREWFFAQGFLEVETPILTAAPGLEPHLDPLLVNVRPTPSGTSERRWLHTSPEIALKRVLASLCHGGGDDDETTTASAANVYQLARVFRDGENGPLHRPEFTMLEWYRAPGTLDELILDCQHLGQALAGAVAPSSSTFSAPIARVSVADLFAERGLDLDRALDHDLGRGGQDLAEQARAAGMIMRAGTSFERAFFDVMDKIEPSLGAKGPVVVERYPRSMAVLARLCHDDDRYAARFELYFRGVELANAFDELTDGAEQRRRFQADNEYRLRLGKEPLPIDEGFLADLDRLPRCAGIALGFDRLLMLLRGFSALDDVVGSEF